MTDVVVTIGAGSIGQAVARRVGSGRHVAALSPAEGRALATTPDEVASLAALVMGPDGSFITGSDLLIDGGATASYFYGPLRTG